MPQPFPIELCADELVVGGGVGWSYDRRRRRVFHRRRRRGFMVCVGSVRPDERAVKQRTRWTGVFPWFYRGQPLHLWFPLGCWCRKVNCEYACCAQFHSRNEWIVHCLISGDSYKCNVECWGNADGVGVENTALENVGKIWQSSNG